MSWQNNITKGLYRIALVLSTISALIVFLGGINSNENIFFIILISGVVFAIVFGIILIINYIIRGFTG